MTVRELIVKLLDFDLDSEVLRRDATGHEGMTEISGVDRVGSSVELT